MNNVSIYLTIRQISFWEEKQYDLEVKIEFYESLNNWYFKVPILIFTLGVATYIVADRLKNLKDQLCSIKNRINKLESDLEYLKTGQSVESKRLNVNGQSKEISRHTRVNTVNSTTVSETPDTITPIVAASLYTSSFDTSSSCSSSSSSDYSSSSSDSGSCGCD